MSSKIRNYARSLQRGENVPEFLPAYVSESMRLYNTFGKTKMMMEYYVFYQLVCDDDRLYRETVKDSADSFHRLLSRLLENPSREEMDGLTQEVLKLRSEVADIMREATCYVDILTVYEYILNRVQYRFEDMEMQVDDAMLARDLVNFIFSSDDQAVINDNIRTVLGQLPIRMARSKYYDLIRDSILLYQGGDMDTLEAFLYMFRSSAMLSGNDNRSPYFSELAETAEELSQLDFENITEDAYHLFSEKVDGITGRVTELTDMYLLLGQLVNNLYMICSTAHFADEADAVPEAVDMIREINAMFADGDYFMDEHREEKMKSLDEKFVAVEGKQERLYESLNTSAAALEGILESCGDTVNSEGLVGDFEVLNRLSLLLSDSVFANFEDEDTGEKVTQEIAERAAEELIEECRQFLRGKSRLFRRAVMANTLGNMPMFFKSAQEVADYVTASLEGCDDEAEKYASKQLLMEFVMI